MNLPAAILVIRWLVRDTFRQALASRILQVLLGVTLLCVGFCLSTGTEDLPLKPVGEPPERLPTHLAPKDRDATQYGVDVIAGKVTFLFGAVEAPWTQYREEAVRWLQLVLAAGVADTIGLLFALIWTAAFLPTFLEPTAVTVLLAKPVPRWSLLAGKYLGVLAVVAFQSSIFIIGTWLALGLRTDVWEPRYLLCIPLLVIHFAVFFSFSAFLAVWTRSTIACVFGSLLFWFMCWGMNYGRHAALAHSDFADNVTGVSVMMEVGYWVLPKPADMGYLLALIVESEKLFPLNAEISGADRWGYLSLELSLLSSIVFALVMLAIAGYEFVQADY